MAGTQKAKRERLLKQIARTAQKVRKAQSEYFNNRTQSNLIASKTVERELDILLKELRDFDIVQDHRRGLSVREMAANASARLFE